VNVEKDEEEDEDIVMMKILINLKVIVVIIQEIVQLMNLMKSKYTYIYIFGLL